MEHLCFRLNPLLLILNDYPSIGTLDPQHYVISKDRQRWGAQCHQKEEKQEDRGFNRAQKTLQTNKQKDKTLPFSIKNEEMAQEKQRKEKNIQMWSQNWARDTRECIC